MTPSDRMFAAARDTARQAARRQHEADTDWSDFVDEVLAVVGDHSLELAVHTGRAMRAVEGDDDGD